MFIGSLIFTLLLGLRYKWGMLEGYADFLVDISNMIKNKMLIDIPRNIPNKYESLTFVFIFTDLSF